MSLLHDLVFTAARRWPDRPAVSTDTETVSYAELAAATARLAGMLAESGVRRGDRVVAVGPSGPLTAALIYACSRVGAAFCVLHEQVVGKPLAHVLDEAEPALVIAADAWSAAHDLAFGPGPVPEDLGPEPLPVDAVCLIYTSGTTSAPSAVVSTQQQVCFAIEAIRSVLVYETEDVVYCPLPLSFDYGMYQLFLAAAVGAHVRLGRPADAGPGLLRNLVAAQATVLAAVPSVAEALSRLLRRDSSRVPPLRLLTNTGAAMPPEVLRDLRAGIPGLRVQLMFGLTECKRATIMPPDGDLDRPGSSGLALPGTEVFTVDGSGNRLGAREIGELVVRGPNVMSGYWRRPEQTAARFPRNEGLFPELRTGDHGWLDEDGYVYVVGRLDDIYKERGFRVSAAEVEAAARRVPGVELAAVVPPLDGRPALLAVVGESTPAEVLSLMRAEIEEFKIPRHCVVVESLPLTRNGKVDRKRLAEVSGA
ncbi:class I adenylate-forming enzyme family protein [Actinokineospora sp. NBRC 105648]|uniref:class I adenylate-forming enzyme family protein n=1 Tax=Actinokineospora sp. NBRC 105648 TaxID=3032206 RepID=UPI0024A0A2E7|nr:class I adenylate-forming enzyme family protein [Actinokineospora sp. NBRC 105648]GLZ39690.1 long-chain acyl-CoA synthetase [Actinokineospora sp. NBRC 105648]